MSERTHCASTSASIVLRDASTSDPSGGAYKPTGFWYEVDSDWRRWCEGVSFSCGDHLHRVDLNDCNVLFIDTLEKLDAFDKEFHWHRPISADFSLRQIEWPRVAERYDGIEIAPYQWARRLDHDFMWYYGWDCASGVIWRPKNASVTYIGEWRTLTTTQPTVGRDPLGSRSGDAS